MFYYINQLCTPSFPLFYMTCPLEDTWVGVSGSTVPPGFMESEFENSNQEASPSTTKNTGVVLGPSSRTEACSYNYFWWCRYF